MTPVAPLTLVVGGTGRVGARVVERLIERGGGGVRVMARDASSEGAKKLASTAGVQVIQGDATRAEDCARACEGTSAVIACFGAQRIARLSDVLAVDGSPEREAAHPRNVNYGAVETLARCAADAGCARFVRVTGMSVGYPAFDWIAVLLNVVLSMTIQWQLAGEIAIRKICREAKNGMKYVIVRPGNLSDDEECAKDETGNRRVLLGSGDAHVHAGKVSRNDVADVIVEALGRSQCENVTLSVAGSVTPSGGMRTELVWDPARGMHWQTVGLEKTVSEGTSYLDDRMWRAVVPDSDELKPKPHRRYVAMFLALVAGISVLLANAAVSLARALFF